MRVIRWCGVWAVALLLLGAHFSAAQAAQTGGGQICVQAFEDKDGNGVRTEASEPLLPNVGFTLSNASGRLGTYTTDGNSEPYCFGNLTPGQYTVQARQSPKRGEATTPGQWVIPLANNAQYDVAYGVQLGGQADETSAQGTSSGSGMSTLGRIALGLLGLAILGVAGFLAYQLLLRLRKS